MSGNLRDNSAPVKLMQSKAVGVCPHLIAGDYRSGKEEGGMSLHSRAAVQKHVSHRSLAGLPGTVNVGGPHPSWTCAAVSPAASDV